MRTPASFRQVQADVAYVLQSMQSGEAGDVLKDLLTLEKQKPSADRCPWPSSAAEPHGLGSSPGAAPGQSLPALGLAALHRLQNICDISLHLSETGRHPHDSHMTMGSAGDRMAATSGERLSKQALNPAPHLQLLLLAPLRLHLQQQLPLLRRQLQVRALRLLLHELPPAQLLLRRQRGLRRRRRRALHHRRRRGLRRQRMLQPVDDPMSKAGLHELWV